MQYCLPVEGQSKGDTRGHVESFGLHNFLLREISKREAKMKVLQSKLMDECLTKESQK